MGGVRLSRVLLVCNESEMASACLNELSHHMGIGATMAASMDDARSMLVSCRYNAIVLDVRGADPDMITFLKEAREQHYLSLIMLGDPQNGPFLAKAINAGLNRFVDVSDANSCHVEEITGTIRSLLEENAHRESLDWYLEVIRGMDTGLFVYRLQPGKGLEDLILVDMNPTAQRMAGWGEEVLGQTITQHLPPGLECFFQEYCKAYLDKGSLNVPHFCRPDQEGAIRDYGAEIMPLPNDHLGILIRDITESMETMGELHESEELFRLVADSSGENISLLDMDLKVRYTSPGIERIRGFTVEEALQQKGEDILTPDSLQIVRSVLYEQLAQEGVGDPSRKVVMELEEYHKDGSIVLVENTMTFLRDRSGKPTGIVSIARDITDKKRQEKEARDAKIILEEIIENLPDPTMVINKEGLVTHWNRSLEAITGVDSRDMVGKGDFAYSVPFYGRAQPILADVSRGAVDLDEGRYTGVRREGDILTVDSAMVTGYGRTIQVWANSRPLYDSNGKIVGAIESIRDVTERVKVMDSLRRMNKQLNLMSHIARHDTLNQIMVIQGYLELMRDSIHDPGLLRYLDKLERSATRIRDHIEFTHLYQEVGSQEPQWQRLQDILPDTSEHLHLTFDADVDGLEVLADVMLEKAFYNLLDNSIRHGGDVRKVSLRHEIVPEGLMLLWEDDGVGVPIEVKDRIFERGYGHNTGMGMFLIREILAITGISIRENGVPGQGARFQLLVPPECYRQL